MNKSAFYICALLLAGFAMFIHGVARSFLDDSMHRKAARMDQVITQQIAFTPDPRAVRSGRIYDVLTIVGEVLTAVSIVCMIVALVRREPGWYLILTLLLFFDIVAAMLL